MQGLEPRWEDLEELDPVLYKHLGSLLTKDMDVDDPYNEFYFSYMVPSEQLPPGVPAREVRLGFPRQLVACLVAAAPDSLFVIVTE